MNNKRLDWILIKAQLCELSEWEENFINNMIDNRKKYGNDISISEKQEDVLERIANKC